VAEKLVGFGVQCIGYDPFIKEQIINAGYAEIKIVEFDEILRQSDVVAIHTPLTSHTFNLFNKNTFDKMKPNACIINAARGGIVNQYDLYNAKKSKRS